MKLPKRIFLISLSVLLIGLNLSMFALKPIEVKASEPTNAVAIPYIAEILFSMLMTAGVGIGAYDMMSNAQTQKDVYNDFLEKLENGTITLPDSDNEIFIPDTGTTTGWLRFPLKGDFFSHEEWAEISAWTPPTPEPPEDPEKPPSDNDYWQQLGKQSSFKVNGAFLSTISNYFSDLFQDKQSPLSQKLFAKEDIRFGGKAEKDALGNYLIKVIGYDIDTYAKRYKYSMFNFSHKQRVALLKDSNISYLYQNDSYDATSLSFVSGLEYVQLYGENKPYSDTWNAMSTVAGINTNQWVRANIPIFTSKAALKNYVSKGDITGCINLDPTIDYQVGINRLTDTLRPLIGTRVATQALVDTMKETKTAVADKPHVETDPYIDTFKDTLDKTITATPLPQPDYKPVSPPTYPEIGTDTPPDAPNTLRDWSKIFPFCIPFDMVDVIRVLETTPQAPRFEWLFKIEKLDFEYLFVIDLEMFDNVAKIVRTCELFIFIVGLGFATRGVIKW